MSAVPSVNEGKIQEQEVQFKAGVSEYTARRLASNVNFLFDYHIFDHAFKINGPMGPFSGKNGVDGPFVFEHDATIIDVIIYRNEAGSGGNFQVDIKQSTFPSGAWTSILSTQPVISSSAAAFTTCGVGDSVSGCTAPVISGGFTFVSNKTRLRMDVISTESGIARTGGIIIKYIYR
jgi:hypothetical protein